MPGPVSYLLEPGRASMTQNSLLFHKWSLPATQNQETEPQGMCELQMLCPLQCCHQSPPQTSVKLAEGPAFVQLPSVVFTLQGPHPSSRLAFGPHIFSDPWGWGGFSD